MNTPARFEFRLNARKQPEGETPVPKSINLQIVEEIHRRRQEQEAFDRLFPVPKIARRRDID